ncbi:hypothetical protein DPMN_135245 [Dreissena polymorpha]|uniref:Uncharacterized protein n=1 Tax=Dreissena polymorpha TaxID=45954 RepID=A0A9D4JBG5_DREPO|nr:hypothetical protein DPMN_135245 [Dreissena polymorpha]
MAPNITIRVSCTVTIGRKYANMTAMALFYKNLPPYGGTCKFTNREDVEITFGITLN